MTTPAEAVAILNRLADELSKRQSDVETFDKAYRGEFRLHYASDDFRDFFADRFSRFSDNWCGIVADAPHERLEVTGIRLKGAERGDSVLWDTWRENDADALSDLAFLDAIIAKRSYALVWGDEDGNPRVTWEHPSQAIVSYDPETRARVAGAKIWADDDREYATLYLPREVFKFERSRVTSGLVGANGNPLSVSGLAGNWEPRQPASDDTWPLDNPLGKVPLVEVSNRPRLMGEPVSDIQGTLAMQHAINLLWAQLFTAADYASFPQRVILGAEMPTVPILDSNGNEVGERPIDLKKFAVNRAVWLEDPATKIDQWDAAKLDVYTDIIEIAVGHIAAQTRTPAHYLLIGGTIANVSGDAMKALETGLVQRTREKTQHFGRSVRDVFELVALVQDDPGKAAAVRGGRVLWKDIENRSDAQLADALSKKKDMGYPLRYLLELDGLPPQEIDRVMSMVEDERDDPTLARLLRPVTPTAEAAPDADLGA
jgi:hypothetical protein